MANPTNILNDVKFFPVDVFPKAYQAIISEISKAFCVQPQVPGCAILIGTAACAGNAVSIQVKPGWREHANLFLLSIGKSGDGKSPAHNAVLRIIGNLEKWRSEEDTKSEKNPNYISAFATYPQWSTLIVDDITLQGLNHVLSKNPRGVLWYRDEFEGLFFEMNKSPVAKSRIRTAFDSGPWNVDRVTENRTFRISKATLSLAGTIQPEIIREVITERDLASGFLARFLFFNTDQDRPRIWSDVQFGEKSRKALEEHFLKVLSLDYEDSAIREPMVMQLTPDAKNIYTNFYDKCSKQLWFNDSQLTDSFSMKMRIHTQRIALALRLMDWTAGDASSLKWIQAETMHRAIKLSKYFSRETEKAYGIIFNKVLPLKPNERLVAKAILSLSTKIRGGMLGTQAVTDKCNENLTREFQLNARQVGKIAKNLKLQTGAHMPKSSVRGIGLTQGDLERLKEMI